MLNKILIILLLASFSAHAERTAKDGRVDSRLKTITYSENDVVKVHAHYGRATHIEFGVDEVIQVALLGDSIPWQTENVNNNLFLLPIEDNASTNLTVMTNLRTYYFDLIANDSSGPNDKSLSFRIKFIYPEDIMTRAMDRLAKEAQIKMADVMPDRQMGVDSMNFNYSGRGVQEIAPVRAFDDGEFTYLQFKNMNNLPAIFSVNRDRSEALVRYEIKGQYLVIKKIAAQFMLRAGSDVACIFNDNVEPIPLNAKLNVVASSPIKIIRVKPEVAE